MAREHMVKTNTGLCLKHNINYVDVNDAIDDANDNVDYDADDLSH